MNFSTDRDLLALEPQVFGDVPLLGQQRVHTTDAAISGVALTSASANFINADVAAGSVVLVAGTALEVTARTDVHTLAISLLRTRPADLAIPPVPGTNLELIVRTFAPQAALVHDMLLRMIGIEPDDPGCPLQEDRIVSLSVLSRLEALGVLERVYSAAAGIVGDNQAILQKAAYYRERFSAGCQRAVILLDADGDGYADQRRSLSLIQLTRA